MPRKILVVFLLAAVACGSESSAEIDPGDGGNYSVELDPATFVTVIDNPLFALTPGDSWSYESTGTDDAYAAIRARLTALYGDKASLAVSSDVFRGTTVIAEVPHERHPGDHR